MYKGNWEKSQRNGPGFYMIQVQVPTTHRKNNNKSTKCRPSYFQDNRQRQTTSMRTRVFFEKWSKGTRTHREEVIHIQSFCQQYDIVRRVEHLSKHLLPLDFERLCILWGTYPQIIIEALSETNIG